MFFVMPLLLTALSAITTVCGEVFNLQRAVNSSTVHATLALAAHHGHAMVRRTSGLSAGHQKGAVTVKSAVITAQSQHGTEDQSEVPNLKHKLQRLADWSKFSKKAMASINSDISSVAQGRPHLQRRRVAFLFLVNDALEFSDLWEAFFAAADPQDYTILVHAAEKNHSMLKLPERFRDKLVPHVATKWCHLTRAQFSMLRKALRDDSVESFVWVSADTVPLKPFRFVHAQVMKSPNSSRFCVDERFDRAEMWNLLSRQHAEALLANEEALFKIFGELATDLPNKVCEDEDMFWAPLALMGFKKELMQQCFMWTDWDSPLRNHTASLLNLGPVSKAQWLDADWLQKADSNFKVWGGLMHPWTFTAVPVDGMQKLLRDPKLWFARKFLRVGEHFGGGVFNKKGHRLDSIEGFLFHAVNFSGPEAGDPSWGDSGTDADERLEKEEISHKIDDVTGAETLLHSAVTAAAKLAHRTKKSSVIHHGHHQYSPSPSQVTSQRFHQPSVSPQAVTASSERLDRSATGNLAGQKVAHYKKRAVTNTHAKAASEASRAMHIETPARKNPVKLSKHRGEDHKHSSKEAVFDMRDDMLVGRGRLGGGSLDDALDAAIAKRGLDSVEARLEDAQEQFRRSSGSSAHERHGGVHAAADALATAATQAAAAAREMTARRANDRERRE